MKHSAIYLLVIMLVFGIVTASRAETDYAQYLPKWLELLKIGNAREKKLALHSLWFLQYGEFRKDKKVFDPILEALKDKDPSIREAAAACLKAIGGDVLWSVDDEARSQNSGKGTIIAPALIKALLEDESPRVRAEAAKVLGKYGRYRSDRRGRSRVDKEEQAVEPLINALKDKDPWVRLNAAFSLGELEAQKAVQPLIALLEDNADWRNKYVQQEVIAALRKIGVLNMDIEFSRVLLKISGDEYLKAEILDTFATDPYTDYPEAKEVFLKASNDPNARIRKLAVKGIARRFPMHDDTKNGPSEKFELLTNALKDPSPDVRANLAKGLRNTGDPRAVAILIELLKSDSDAKVQRSTIESLSKFSDDRIFDALADFIGRAGYVEQSADDTFMLLAERSAIQKINKEEPGGTFKQLVNKPAATALLTAIDRAAKDYNKERIIRLMGNFEDERITMKLTKLLDDTSPDIRKKAVNSLRRNINGDLIPPVLTKLKDEDPQVRKEAATMLGYSSDRRALEPLLELLNDKNSDVRSEAIRAIGYLNDKNTIEPLMKMLKDDNASVRSSALEALRHFDDRRISDVSIEMLKDKNSFVRCSAIRIVQKMPDARAVDLLIPLLNDSDCAPSAAEALGMIGDNRAVEPLIGTLYGDFNKKRMLNGGLDLRKAALNALIKIDKEKAMPALIKVALNKNDDSQLRNTAATAIIEIDGSSGVDIFKRLIYEENYSGGSALIDVILKVNVDEAVTILIALLNTNDDKRIIQALIYLRRIKSPIAIKPLVKTAGRRMDYSTSITNALKDYRNPDMTEILMGYLKDDDLLVKKGAIILLGEFREKKAIESLKPFLEDKDQDIRTLAKDSISKIEPATAEVFPSNAASTSPWVDIAYPRPTDTLTFNEPYLIYYARDGKVIVTVDGKVVNKLSGQLLGPLAAGRHTVQVQVTDSSGQTASKSVTFTISEKEYIELMYIFPNVSVPERGK